MALASSRSRASEIESRRAGAVPSQGRVAVLSLFPRPGISFQETFVRLVARRRRTVAMLDNTYGHPLRDPAMRDRGQLDVVDAKSDELEADHGLVL